MKKITLFLIALTFSFTAMAQAMHGTYKVGTNGTEDFASLSAAVTALNTNGVDGNVILEITSDITEAANIGLGVNTGSYSITIRPDVVTDPNTDPVRTITFSSTTDNKSPSGHFVIGYPTTGLTAAWSDANTIATSNVTIDGFADNGNTRRLKFTTANASMSASKLTVIVGACQNTTIKNCIYESKSTGTSAQCIGMVTRKGTAIEVGPSNVTIENNLISSTSSGSGQGINTTNSGTPTTGVTNGLIIRNNTITAQGRCVWLYYVNGAEIYNNTFNLIQAGSAGTINYGLWTSTGATGTFNIYNNKFVETSTMEASASGTLGMRTISVANGTYNIFNNTFSGLNKKSAATATINLTYIFFGGTAGKIFNNTFYMPALTNNTSPGYYQAITLSYSNPDIKNNIFISNEDAVVNAFYGSVSTGAIDYNIYYNRAGTTKSLIVSGTTNSTLALHQAANPTKDINSKSVDVNFVDAATGDLRITGASIQDANLAVPRLDAVLTDMFGTDRYMTTYAGAHESTHFITTDTENPTESARIMTTATGVEVILSSEATIELYTINGMLLDKVKTSSYSRDLNNGVYIIRINGKATKFIK